MQLEELDLSENILSAGLDLAMGQLQRLKKLNLHECNLTSVSPWLGRLEAVIAFITDVLSAFYAIVSREPVYSRIESA